MQTVLSKKPEDKKSSQSGHADPRLSVSAEHGIGASPGLPLFLQPKLAISQPGDPYEQEADRVAGQVMRMPDPEFPSSQQDGGIEGQVDSTRAMLHRMASPTESEGGSPYDEGGQCSGWRKDPQSLSKRAAETYVQLHRTPPSQATVERIECEPPLTNGNYGCTVYFSDGIVIRVIVREADIVVGTAPLQTMTPPSATPLCFFSYACPDGELVLTVKECRSAKPVAPVGTATMVQRQCAACAAGGPPCSASQEDSVTISRKAAGSVGYEVPASVQSVLSSSGSPLSGSTRAFFEPRFGHDLSHVRVHTDAAAHRSAQEVSALAYTVGSHIAFDAGRYAPQSPDGQRLLAHELTHVVQGDKDGIYLRTIFRQPTDEEDDKPTAVKPIVCPGGGPPFDGVCISDEILDALLQQTDFDLKKAQEVVLPAEVKAARAKKRQERTIKKFGGDNPNSLVAAYQEALEQYLNTQDAGSKRKYRAALHRLEQGYQRQVDLSLQNPEWRDKYDLLTLQQMVEEQLPQIAATRIQDVNEYFSTPNWTVGERLQMDLLKKDIKGWTDDEQQLARNLLWRWFELTREGRHPSAAKDTIIKMTEQKLEQWLRAADRAREQDCKENPMGIAEKVYRIHGFDRCKPLFDEKHPKSTVFHGPHELMDFRIKMNLRLSEKESPASLVFECVKQYRRQTNIDEQLKAMQAQALVGMGLHLTSVATTYSMAKTALRGAPATTPVSSNFSPNEVGQIVDTPMGPQKVRAIMPNGDLVLDPIVKVLPPANRVLPSGSPGSANVPTAKPPIGVARPGAGTFMPSQAGPFDAQTALPPGSIFATTPPPMANVASGEIVSPHAPALGPSVPGPNQPKVYVRFQPETFETQDAAAIDALKLSNPYSIAAGRELAGQTFQTPEGRWGYSGPVMIPEEQSISKGRVDSRPEDAAVHPDWGIATGDFHTHGSYQSVREGILMENPRWKPDDFRLQQAPWEQDTMLWQHTDNLEIKMLPDEFSFADIQRLTVMAREAGVRWTSYVGTPSGKFRMMYSNPGDGPSTPVVIYPPKR